MVTSLIQRGLSMVNQTLHTPAMQRKLIHFCGTKEWGVITTCGNVKCLQHPWQNHYLSLHGSFVNASMRWFRWSSWSSREFIALICMYNYLLFLCGLQWQSDVVDVCVRGANQYLLHCISNVHGIGKATFLWYFFQYTSFITGKDSNIKGTLADTFVDMQICSQGFLAFIRLVGTMHLLQEACLRVWYQLTCFTL